MNNEHAEKLTAAIEALTAMGKPPPQAGEASHHGRAHL